MPSTGEGPYILSADIDQPALVDGVNYRATIFSTTEVGSCPTSGVTWPLAQPSVDAIVQGTPTNSATSDLAIGSCRVWTLNIIQISNNMVVATANTAVSNI